MANSGPLGNPPQLGLPTPPKGDPIARYATYLEAQRAVDFLSDNSFPVQYVTIVGSGLRMVERVTGRQTYARVAVAGAISGAWLGVFVGLLMVLFSSGGSGGPFIAGPMIGAAFGLMYGVISYALTRGRRDFTSISQIVASEYDVLCLSEHKGAAIELLNRLDGGAGNLRAMPGPNAAQPRFGRVDLPPPTGQPSPGPAPTPHPAPGFAPPDGAAPIPPPAAPSQPPVTYGEMIERKRREERERQAMESGNSSNAEPS